jgi:hypothetical protein
MPEIEDVAFKIAAAYEDLYFVPGKKNLFIAVFNQYLPMVDPELKMLEPYDAIVELGYRYREAFDEMIGELKKLSLIS